MPLLICDMDPLQTRIANLQADIQAACRRAGRAADACRLLAVSKTRPVDDIRRAVAAGLTDFGENHVQEALPKIAALAELGLVWHLIGPLQSNKTREVAAHFTWVHSLDREKIARRLNDQRPDHLPPLRVCIQVNSDHEDSKAGVAPAEAAALAQVVTALPRLQLRGLMTIPRPNQPGGPDNAYARLATTMQTLAGTIPGLGHSTFDTLSMGMSDDFERAILHGATWVRIGTALFGHRAPGAAPATTRAP